MPRLLVGTIAIAGVMALGSTALGTGERFEDAVGDALGDARDIIAIVVDEPDGTTLRFSIEYASDAVVEDGAAHTDFLWVALDTTPDVTIPEYDGFSMATIGPSPAGNLGRGHLTVGADVLEGVVDVVAEGPFVTFSLDRQLLGDPTELYFRVYGAALHETLYTEEVDHFPEEDQPPARHVLSQEQG